MKFLKSIYLFVRSILSLLIALPATLRSRTIRWIVAIVAVIIVGAGVYRFLFPLLPPSVQVFDVVWLKQGWTEDQRQKSYQTSQGTLIIPYSWFFALEQPPALKWPMVIGGKVPFHSDTNMTRYRAIPDARAKYNPDRLPVGVTKAVLADKYVDQLGQGHKEWLSYTCAFCHTTQINYKGTGIRIDGGPGNLDFTAFNTALANILTVTATSPSSFNRFAEKVLRKEGQPETSEQKERVRAELQAFLRSPVITRGVMAILEGTYPTHEGFGRMDALGRGVNGQFGQLDQRNIGVANAPVSIPPIWYTHDYDWVQTISAISQPMARNVTESWGVNASVDLINPDPQKLYASSVDMKNMFWIETLVSILDAPEWPENIFGPIDSEAAQRGKYLYSEKVFDNALDPSQEQCGPQDGCRPLVDRPRQGLCARCHAPVLEAAANQYGRRYYQLPLYKLEVIGTDPGDARNFNGRMVYTGNLKQTLFDGSEQVGIGLAFLKTSTEIMNRQYNELNVSAEQRVVMDGFRSNGFRAPLAYPARPLAGYWATAPYLHNNSVPNLYQLLSPVKERDSSFWVGSLEFDPVHVGYETGELSGGFEFRTTESFTRALWQAFLGIFKGEFDFRRVIDGNSNAGHEFRDAPKGTPGVIGPALSPRERLDIVEYLKSIRDVAPLSQAERDRREKLLYDMRADYEGKVSK